MENKKTDSLNEESGIIGQLDELLVDYLELMDVYVKSALDEESSYKDGLMDIAHARICMTPNMISIDGFPNETTPDMSAASTITLKGDGESHRVLNIDTKKDRELLNLFGRNIPASLKKAQVTFQQVLEGVVDRANILQKMRWIEEKQSELVGKRRTLQGKIQTEALISSSCTKEVDEEEDAKDKENRANT